MPLPGARVPIIADRYLLSSAMWGETVPIRSPFARRSANLNACIFVDSAFRLFTLALALLFISITGPADVTYAPTRGGGARVFLSGHSPRRLGAPHFTVSFDAEDTGPDRR